MRRWDILENTIKGNNLKDYVEVGCKEGRTVGHLLHTCPDLLITAIDPWEKQPDGNEDYAEWNFKAIEKEFKRNLGEHSERVTFHRAYSTDVRCPADLVFIDAQHDYDSCLRDIDHWWPQVNDGGFLAGHDYNHNFPGVQRAVAERFNLMEVCLFSDSVWMVPKI